MPLKLVPPDAFLYHQGIIIYHAYDDGMYNDVMNYWYTTSLEEDDDYEFDVRDLEIPDNFSEDDHKEIIKKAIDENLLELPEEYSH